MESKKKILDVIDFIFLLVLVQSNYEKGKKSIDVNSMFQKVE